jgi:hypothetical protein
MLHVPRKTRASRWLSAISLLGLAWPLAPEAQAQTANYLPPQQQPAAPRWQLGVVTRVVNLNEYVPGGVPSVGSAMPVGPSGAGRDPGFEPGGRATGSFFPVAPSPAGRDLPGSLGSAGPVGPSSASREIPLAPGSAAPVGPSGAGRENRASLAPPPPPAPFPGSALPPNPALALIARNDVPPAMVPAPPSNSLGGEKAGRSSLKPSTAPAPAPAPGPAPAVPSSASNLPLPGVAPAPPQAPMPMPMPAPAPAPPNGPRPMPGPDDDSPLPAPNLGLEITQIVPGSAAQRIGLEPGDVILQLNRYKLESHEQLKWVIANSNGHLRIKVRDVRTGSEIITDLNL